MKAYVNGNEVDYSVSNLGYVIQSVKEDEDGRALIKRLILELFDKARHQSLGLDDMDTNFRRLVNEL